MNPEAPLGASGRLRTAQDQVADFATCILKCLSIGVNPESYSSSLIPCIQFLFQEVPLLDPLDVFRVEPDGSLVEKPPPVTSCTVCGKAGYNISLTNVQCEQRFNGKRCQGVNRSAIGIYDWAKCPKCDGHGGNLTPRTRLCKKCVRCDGAGWLFVRDNPIMTERKITERRRQTLGSRLSR